MPSQVTDQRMLAAVTTAFGGPEVIQLQHLERPTPGPGEVRIRVHATTVSAADHRTRSREVPKGTGLLAGPTIGFRRPRIRVLGMDCAGVVDAVGEGVTRVAVGDEVVALLGSRFGGHAQYAIVGATETAIAPKPKGMPFEEAAAIVFGGWTAGTYLAAAGLKRGDTLLINGASGAVGSAAVQLAAAAGVHVTAVCSGANAELVRQLGAERVIDYTSEDPLDTAIPYDAIMDNVGNLPIARLAARVKSGGTLLQVIANLPDMLLAGARGRRARIRVVPATAKFDATALQRAVDQAELGEFVPVIDRTFDLDDIVAAHRHVDTGHKRGNVVVRVP